MRLLERTILSDKKICLDLCIIWVKGSEARLTCRATPERRVHWCDLHAVKMGITDGQPLKERQLQNVLTLVMQCSSWIKHSSNYSSVASQYLSGFQCRDLILVQPIIEFIHNTPEYHVTLKARWWSSILALFHQLVKHPSDLPPPTPWDTAVNKIMKIPNKDILL